MKVVILCGGKGTRLGGWGEAVPKPLLSVGPQPLLWHIMKIYAAAGFSDFVLCLGHLQERFHEYFAGDVPDAADWRVELVDTGADTPTGGRIRRIERYVDGQEFFATYGDGVADIDLRDLLAFHHAHGRASTVTTVKPESNFGIIEVEADGSVGGFREKPQMTEWVNGGFFVFGPQVFEYLADDSVLEREPLQALAGARQLMAYRHDRFWTCMDTYKDNLVLNEHWASGRPPWRVW
jgi:glucose-1-phosphate cytidylyltransferase